MSRGFEELTNLLFNVMFSLLLEYLYVNDTVNKDRSESDVDKSAKRIHPNKMEFLGGESPFSKTSFKNRRPIVVLVMTMKHLLLHEK